MESIVTAGMPIASCVGTCEIPHENRRVAKREAEQSWINLSPNQCTLTRCSALSYCFATVKVNVLTFLGFLHDNELKNLEEIKIAYNKYWAPIHWAMNICVKALEKKYLETPYSMIVVQNVSLYISPWAESRSASLIEVTWPFFGPKCYLVFRFVVSVHGIVSLHTCFVNKLLF